MKNRGKTYKKVEQAKSLLQADLAVPAALARRHQKRGQQEAVAGKTSRSSCVLLPSQKAW